MAVGDLFYCRLSCTTNNRNWGFGLWLEETTPATPANEGRVISDALRSHISSGLIGMFPAQTVFESVQAWRRYPSSCRPGYTKELGGTGSQSGTAMPNDNALHVNLRQIEQDAKYNGSIYIAGLSSDAHSGNEWTSGYLTTQIKTFTDLLDDPVSAVGTDTGGWKFVVVSKAYTPSATPIGSPFDVDEAVATNRVMSQRRRKQKAKGWSPL